MSFYKEYNTEIRVEDNTHEWWIYARHSLSDNNNIRNFSSN